MGGVSDASGAGGEAEKGRRMAEGLTKRKAGWRRRRCRCGLRCPRGRCHRRIYDELLAVARGRGSGEGESPVGSGGESGVEEKGAWFCEGDLIG